MKEGVLGFDVILRLLLAYGANTELLNSPLYSARSFGLRIVLKALLEHDLMAAASIDLSYSRPDIPAHLYNWIDILGSVCNLEDIEFFNHSLLLYSHLD